MEIVLGVATKVAEYMVGPIARPIGRHIVRPIARPFINLWEYESNLENLKKEVQKLEAKRESVQGLTNVGVEPLPDVKAWQDKVTNIINEVLGLISEDNPEQQSMKCCKGCNYTNLKECYQHRNNVARKLKDVAQLLQEAMKSTNLWEYKSNLEILSQQVEKLVARRESVQRLIKDGEEPLQHVKLWQDHVNKIIDEFSRLINSQQQNMQCCSELICSDLDICYQRRNNVAQMLEGISQLLQEARDFREVSTISEETVYKINLEKLKKEVEKLEAKRDSVICSIKVGEEPLLDVKLWQDRVNSIINEVLGLTSQQNPQQQNSVARMLKDVAQLLHEAMKSISLWEYKSNLENLKKEVEKLVARREGVQRLIKVGEEPLQYVKLWQDNVNKIIDEASGLTSEHSPEQRNKVAQMLKEVAQLLQEAAQFREVSYQPIPEQTCLQPSILQKSSKSRMSILKDIIAALRKADVNMVGIYGMGGVGKTTLVKKVGNQAMQDKLFDKIVFVEVSQSPDIRTIQGVIADHVGLQFEGETVPGRASKLCDYLKNEKKKILIILDNLWKGIKLEEVGIPFGNDCKGLKLMLTTRSRDVLTKGMDLQHNFRMQALSEADAWILFKSIAGTHVDLSHLNSTAIEIAKKCGGMPLAIITVAKALKDTEAKEDWKDALRRLNNPSSESFEGISEEVYNSIKLSYDCLHGKLKEIFLLCSCMGRTYDASVQDLFRYGLGLGYFDEFDRVEDALCNVYASVNQLKAASLLLDAFKTDAFSGHCIPTTGCESFAIHDVICAVARSIASKDRHVFTVLDDHVPRSLTNENTLKNCTSITLYNIDELSKDLQLACPNIKFLYVKLKNSYLTIPDNFFIGTSSLQVLHLIQIDLEPLPISLSCLVNLRALYLDYCKLGDLVVFEDMKKLEILSFRGSSIKQLPKEMHKLTKLRLLDLTDCSELSVIPSKVMSSLTGIEALYMANTSIQWGVARPNIEGSNVSIDELKHLNRLTILEMHIADAKMFRGLISSDLERYKIFIGDGIRWWDDWKPHSKTSRMLRLDLDTKEDWIISQLPAVEELVLKGEVVGAINLLDDLDRNGFPQLMHLHVSCNNHCVCIVNSVSCAVLPSLESLMVQYMESLEKICNSPLGADSFLSLKTIHVETCNKLSNIFCFFSIVTVLPNLIDLKVFDCENMEEIFAIEEQDNGNSTEVVHDIKFSQLSCLRLTNLPKLKSFCCTAKTASPLQLASDTSASQIFSAKELNNPSSLFNEKVTTPNLQELKVHEIHQIEQIWHNLLPTLSSCVQNLTSLSVYRCDNLRELFSSFMAISEELREKERRDTIVFPKLNWLEMGDLTKLTSLCSRYYIEFPSLEGFKIESCPQFKEFIFDKTVATPNLQDLEVHEIHLIEEIWHNLLPTLSSCIQNLTNLSVYRCDNLKELFSSSMTISEQSGEKENKDIIVFPKLYCLEMKHLTKLTRLCSRYSVKFPSLKVFKIRNCPQFKEFIFDETVKIPNLGVLEISNMDNLKMIWHNKLTKDSFSRLKSLQVTKSKKLLTVFPSNMCGRLLSLQSLNIDDCYSLERMFDHQGINSEEHDHVPFMNIQELEVLECPNLKYIFAKGVVAKEVPAKLVFAKLTSLKLNNLPKLRTFYPGKHTVEGPILKKLELFDCGIHYTDEKGQMRQPLYLHAFPCLEELKLAAKEFMMIWQALEVLVVSQNLKKLTLIVEANKGVIFYRKDQTQAATLAKLKTLVLQDLQDLKYMCEQDFKLELIFQNLEVLTVNRCKSLVNLIPPSASFQNLTILNVCDCDGLETIVTSSMAKSLMKLETMRIFLCPKITEVIQNQGDVNEERIIFSNLKILELRVAGNLTSFCSCNFTLEFPSLEELEVWNCWNMETFSWGHLITPKLQKVTIDVEIFRLCPATNLNTIIRQFHEKRCSESVFQKKKNQPRLFF